MGDLGRELLEPQRPTERRDVRTVAEANWRAVRAHPDAIPLIFARRSLDQVTLRSGEALLQALARSGRSGPELLVAFRAVTGFVKRLRAGRAGQPLSHARGESVGVITDRVRSLPPKHFPHLIEIAAVAVTSTPQDEFHAALDIILNGLG